MEVKSLFFYIFALIMVFAAFRVVTAKNPVHAVLYLMLTFSQASGIWLILKAEFLAITLVLVYLGAVMVLFLFVVMMLDINVEVLRQKFWQNFPLAFFIGAIIAIEIAILMFNTFSVSESQVPDFGANVSNSKELGILLYTKYLYPIEIAAVILLVAMIAAIALTLRTRKDTKTISPSVQVKVKAEDRMSIVKMQAVSPSSHKEDGETKDEGVNK